MSGWEKSAAVHQFNTVIINSSMRRILVLFLSTYDFMCRLVALGPCEANEVRPWP